MVEETSFTDTNGAVWTQGTLTDDEWAKVHSRELDPSTLPGIGVAEDNEEGARAGGALSRLFGGRNGGSSGTGGSARGRRGAAEEPPPAEDPPPARTSAEALVGDDEAPPVGGPPTVEVDEESGAPLADGEELDVAATTRVADLAKSTPLKVQAGEGRTTKADQGLKQQVLEEAMAEHVANGGSPDDVSAGQLLEGHGSDNPITLDDGTQYYVETKTGVFGNKYTLVKVGGTGGAGGPGATGGPTGTQGTQNAAPVAATAESPKYYYDYVTQGGQPWDGQGDPPEGLQPHEIVAARTMALSSQAGLSLDQAAVVYSTALSNYSGDPTGYLNTLSQEHQAFKSGPAAGAARTPDPFARLEMPESSDPVNLRTDAAGREIRRKQLELEGDNDDEDIDAALQAFDAEVQDERAANPALSLRDARLRVANREAHKQSQERAEEDAGGSSTGAGGGSTATSASLKWVEGADRKRAEGWVNDAHTRLAEMEELAANDGLDAKGTRELTRLRGRVEKMDAALAGATAGNAASQRKAYKAIDRASDEKIPMPDSLREAEPVLGAMNTANKYTGAATQLAAQPKALYDLGKGIADIPGAIQDQKLAQVYKVHEKAITDRDALMERSLKREEITQFVTRREEASEETAAGKYTPENQVINYAAQVASEGQEGANQAAQTDATTEYTLAQLRELEERRKRQADKA